MIHENGKIIENKHKAYVNLSKNMMLLFLMNSVSNLQAECAGKIVSNKYDLIELEKLNRMCVYAAKYFHKVIPNEAVLNTQQVRVCIAFIEWFDMYRENLQEED